MDLPLEGASLLTKIRRYWTSKHVHKVLLWLWLIGGTIVNFPLNWQESLAWVSFMSLYAIVVGHWGGLEAAKAEEEAKPRGYNA